MSKTIDLIRRRATMAKEAVDEYQGCKIGEWTSANGFMADIPIMLPDIITPSTCTRVKLNGKVGTCYQLTPDYKQRDYWPGGYAEFNITGGDILRLQVALSDIDDAYVLDITNGVYLWKGKNVQ